MFRLTKLIGFTAVSTLLIFSTVMYSACNKPAYQYTDECAGVTCQNNGVCISGTCSCTSGYTGQNCEIRAADLYIGKWAVSQQIIASNSPGKVGVSNSYNIDIVENTARVTLLNFKGFSDNPSNAVEVQIAMTSAIQEVNNQLVEVDVNAVATNFVFKRYQPLGSGALLVKGQGEINELGTQMSGEFYVSYPDTAIGLIEDRVTFSASYIN